MLGLWMGCLVDGVEEVGCFEQVLQVLSRVLVHSWDGGRGDRQDHFIYLSTVISVHFVIAHLPLMSTTTR
jgi:hypothetical protein